MSDSPTPIQRGRRILRDLGCSEIPEGDVSAPWWSSPTLALTIAAPVIWGPLLVVAWSRLSATSPRGELIFELQSDALLPLVVGASLLWVSATRLASLCGSFSRPLLALRFVGETAPFPSLAGALLRRLAQRQPSWPALLPRWRRLLFGIYALLVLLYAAGLGDLAVRRFALTEESIIESRLFGELNHSFEDVTRTEARCEAGLPHYSFLLGNGRRLALLIDEQDEIKLLAKVDQHLGQLDTAKEVISGSLKVCLKAWPHGGLGKGNMRQIMGARLPETTPLPAAADSRVTLGAK